jgi:hypothetical protein
LCADRIVDIVPPQTSSKSRPQTSESRERSRGRDIKAIRPFAPQLADRSRGYAGVRRHSRAKHCANEWAALDPQQAQAALKDAKGTKLVLLGTAAGPVPGRSRQMTSHVMLINGVAYVLDCGMGVTNQYARTGIPFHALKSIFVTHHHADHNIEYGPLLIVGWIQGLPLDVRAFGPPPLKQMTDDFMRAYKRTVDFWAEDFHMKPLTSVNVQEISAAGLVTQDDNVKVSAILVEHPPVKPALGYRFDFKDRSIAFSGDTAPLEAVAKMAEGADVLVHETMYVPARVSPTILSPG